MKSFLILSAFLLALLGPLVNGQCYDLIHQYYQCKNLKMVKSTIGLYPFVLEKYRPDRIIPENELTDRFYRKLVSNEMTFDKAMKVFRKIYTDTENCSSEFCKCASLSVIDLFGNYSFYFRNNAVFPHAKNIIEAFNKKFESHLLPYSELKYKWEFYPLSGDNLTSLTQFCIKHDYSKNRLKYYNKNFTCDSLISIEAEDYDCYWESIVENKTIAWNGNFSNSQLAKLMICQLKRYVNASTEEKRFCTLSYWATVFSRFTWNKDMIAHIDSLLNKAERHKSQIQFTVADINTYSYINMITVKSKVSNYSSKLITDQKYKQVCFDSTSLRVDCEWTLTSRGVLLWDWANFTFNFDESTSRTITVDMTFSADSPFEYNDDITDEMTIKDKFGDNWIFIKNKEILYNTYYYMIDINSNITIVMSTNYIGIIFPKKMVIDGANGLAVDGFPELEMDLDSKRKRRSIDSMEMNTANVMSCQTMCDQTNQQSPITDMDSLIGSKVVYNKCVNDCLLPKNDN